MFFSFIFHFHVKLTEAIHDSLSWQVDRAEILNISNISQNELEFYRFWKKKW